MTDAAITRERGEPALSGGEALPARLPIEARRHRLVAVIARNLRQRCGVDAAAPLVVGVSGGADSVALLVAATVLRDRSRRSSVTPVPMAVHVHHHLRDRSADADLEFVQVLCGRLGVPLRVEHVDPRAERRNVAEAARVLRYDALRRVALSIGAARVAVAHHGDDQLETMLIALCRGAGLAGLGGMMWTRPLGDGVHLVRPMLTARAADARSLCRAARVAWRSDPGNHDPETVRGRLRRDVLPTLEMLWPEAARRVTATGDALAVAREAFEDLVTARFGPPDRRRFARSDLAAAPPAVIAAGLRRAAPAAVPEVGDALGQRPLLLAAERIAGPDRQPRRYDWPRGLRLIVTAREVRLEHAGHPTGRSRNEHPNVETPCSDD